MTADWHARLSGVFTALVTPFRGGEIDWPAFDRLVERQIDAGVAGLVPVGTTGEAATLTADESECVIRRTVEIAAGRAVVLAGAGKIGTARTIGAVKRAEALGADGCLLVTPYYNMPDQNGLFSHYAAIAGATSLPLMLYSVPGRTGVDLAPDTVGRLARSFANITAIKEAGGRCERVTALRAACPEGFGIHCGDDLLTLPFIALGAVGVTSVVANLAPEATCALVAAARRGDHAHALALHEALAPLLQALFAETNPVPVKAALALEGAMLPDVRLPLTPMSAAGLARLAAALDRFAGRANPALGLQKTPHVPADR